MNTYRNQLKIPCLVPKFSTTCSCIHQLSTRSAFFLKIEILNDFLISFESSSFDTLNKNKLQGVFSSRGRARTLLNKNSFSVC